MIELTREQRLEAYKYALDNISTNRTPFICILLKKWININTDADLPNCLGVERHFPEFEKYRPSMIKEYGIWWPESDIQSRVDLLNHIINELETEIKNEK